MNDSTKRFSSRVENYVRYRPGYPVGVIETLRQECGLTPAHAIADIGSGTGFLSQLLLRNGNRVYGVEPNREMRRAAEQLLSDQPNFVSVDGTAEATTLADASVDFVCAGQAFHWFDPQAARREFARILRPGGWVVLVWNYRRIETAPMMQAYEAIVKRYSDDYEDVSHHRPEYDDASVRAFFGPQGCGLAVHPNEQHFDFAGLRGRLLSSSYAPEAGHPNHEPMLADLRALFEQYQQQGRVTFEYDTKVYFGRLTNAA
jgi:SAM-dependent methyltransferase